MHEILDMETIQAAHNLTIELSPTSWRLYNGVQSPDRPGALAALVEATENGLACSPAFVTARKLPGLQLAPSDVARVVVGWAPESRNWHLGVLLAARPEQNYRMQWCGLASWPAGPATEHSTLARLAGQSLARVLDRPFHLVPAAEPGVVHDETRPVEVTTPMTALDAVPAEPEVDLEQAPFAFEDWTFDAIPKGYLWQLRGRSVVMTGLRAIVLLVLLVFFVVLGVGTQTSGLAAIKPGWLPWVGLAVAGLMIVLALQSVWSFFALADVIVDTQQAEIRRRSRISGRVQWRVAFDSVAYVILSQTPAQQLGRFRASKGGTARIGQDAWLHVYDGKRFLPVADLGRVEGQSHSWEKVRDAQRQKGRRLLRLAEYDTDAHHAAVFFSNVLGADVWLDIV